MTLVDKSDRFVFKPLLYELINGAAQLEEVAPRYTQLLQPYTTAFVQVHTPPQRAQQAQLHVQARHTQLLQPYTTASVQVHHPPLPSCSRHSRRCTRVCAAAARRRPWRTPTQAGQHASAATLASTHLWPDIAEAGWLACWREQGRLRQPGGARAVHTARTGWSPALERRAPLPYIPLGPADDAA